MTKVAIITVDYNNHPDTLALAESVKKLNCKNLDVKVLYIDNASQEPLVVKGEIIQTGENKGFAGGNNQGIRYALQWGADYVLIVNNDVLFPDKNLLQSLIKTDADVVSPKILFAPGFEFHKERYSDKEKGHVIWYAGGSFDWNNVQTVHRGINDVDEGQYDATEPTAFASGCCVMVKGSVFGKIGLYDERLWMYFEDADFARRVGEAGLSQMYSGATFIYHKVSRSSGIGSPLTDYLTTRNQLVFSGRYATSKTNLALARQALKFLLSGRPGQRRGVWDYLIGQLGQPNFVKNNLLPVYPIKLSIIIINYKTVDLTRECIESIYKFAPNFPFEVILIDNASEDDCAEMVKKFPQVKFIANQVNRGFSGGNNQGIDYARGQYLLLLNSDAAVKKAALQNLVEEADRLGGGAITAGRLFFPDGTNQDSVYKLPTVWGAIQEYFLKKPGSYFMYRPDKLTQVECAVMACLMIPRAVVNKIGNLDEGTFMYFEDIEYCRRAKGNNIKVFFVPQAEFIHHHGASSKKIGQDKSYELLKKGSYHYHGLVNYWLLYWVLWLGQRWGAKSPESRWQKS